MSDLDDFWVHTASVETYVGTGANGDVFAAAVDVIGFNDTSRRLVRDQDGQQVVSEGTFYCDTTYQGLFPAGSVVTVDGVQAVVIRCDTKTSGDLGLPDHIAVSLT